MSDVHRTGRIGRNEFHINPFALARIRFSERRAGFQNLFEAGIPERFGQTHIDEAGAGDFNAFNNVAALQFFNQQRRKITRFHPDLRSQNHRRVRRRIAMSGVSGRFGDDA